MRVWRSRPKGPSIIQGAAKITKMAIIYPGTTSAMACTLRYIGRTERQTLMTIGRTFLTQTYMGNMG